MAAGQNSPHVGRSGIKILDLNSSAEARRGFLYERKSVINYAKGPVDVNNRPLNRIFNINKTGHDRKADGCV